MKRILLAAFLIAARLMAYHSDSERIVDLNGIWKFEIGDNIKFADPSFDDSRWEDVRVPSSWEDEGFPGYDGFAWYRLKFRISEKYSSESIYLSLGAIDDVDEVYLNGK